MDIPTIEQTIRRMKDEVEEDIETGRVPPTVKRFSELHDYVDANAYGGFCEDGFADAMVEHFGGRDEHDGMPDAMLHYINEAQSAIDTWLQAGRPH